MDSQKLQLPSLRGEEGGREKKKVRNMRIYYKVKYFIKRSNRRSSSSQEEYLRQ